MFCVCVGGGGGEGGRVRKGTGEVIHLFREGTGDSLISNCVCVCVCGGGGGVKGTRKVIHLFHCIKKSSQ